mmetsp:Transcript_51402/g.95046  ORF Transcript_51402/g.95046 Transcript_51402/m.95046 type:complete len:96 (+) Transcript_51402:1233-1520(+)
MDWVEASRDLHGQVLQEGVLAGASWHSCELPTIRLGSQGHLEHTQTSLLLGMADAQIGGESHGDACGAGLLLALEGAPGTVDVDKASCQVLVEKL